VIRRRTALALLAALALLVAGCGSDSENKGDPIPAANVTELQKQLDAIEARFNHGDGACADITGDSEPAVSRALDQIPSSVDRETRDSLRQSFERLFRLTSDQCDTTPTDTTETETDTTPTQTLPETQPTETQQTETQQTEPEKTPPGQQKQKKPKQNNGNGNGNGGGAPAPGAP
jgi:outer membrane biosynthesis protein TonB